MKIRNKLFLIYNSIVTVLLSLFCLVIFFQSKNYRKQEFKGLLRKEALSAANIFFTQNDISSDLLKILDRNNYTALSDEEIVIYDRNQRLIYETGTDKFRISKAIFDKINVGKEHYWSNNHHEFLGLIFQNNGKNYTVIAYAVDKLGFIKLKNLAYVLVFGSSGLLILSALAGWFFVNKMLSPIQDIIKKIDKIKASQLDERLVAGNQKDEFYQLTDRFNQMLDRLEKSFKTQKAFVSNASHELRTPLTSITGQIQVSLLANDDPEDLRQMIQSVLEDVKQLNRLSNNLLDLTSLEYGNPRQEFTLVNILDKISRVRNEVLKKCPESRILINFEVNEEEIPELIANPYLLYTAFFNLFDNGVKYSPYKTVIVNVTNKPESILVEINNKCLITKSDELKYFFEPFKRGLNSKHIYGHGVGLSLVKGIIELHSGTISVELIDAGEISFKVSLPKKI